MRNNQLVSQCHQVIALTIIIGFACGPVMAADAESAISDKTAASASSQTSPATADATVKLEGASAATTATEAAAAAPSVTPSPSATILETPTTNEKVLLKPGQPLSINMAAEDLVPTQDIPLAQQQVAAYPNSPEAAFILAVALTRTSRVEEALKEVQRAKRLAAAQGGAEYFDKMIQSYEDMLQSCPDDNRVRYGLAWAYYMKAYLLGKANPKPKTAAVASAQVAPTPAKAASQPNAWINNAAANQILSVLSPNLGKQVAAVPGQVSSQSLPHIPGALEVAAPSAVPQIKDYMQKALKNLDEILARDPADVWARLYRAHLNAEFTGNLSESMTVWHGCSHEFPQNPGPYFFLAEGYLKEGNLKECFNNISRAIALRAMGN